MGLTSGPCSLLPASHAVLAHTTSASNTSFSPAFPPPRLPLPPMFSTPRAEWPFPNTDTVGPLLEQPTLQRLPIALRLDTSASWLQVTLLTLCASAVAASPAISLLCLSYTVFQRLEQKKVPCHLLGFQTVLSEASLTNTPSASNSTLRPQLLSSPPLGNLRQPRPSCHSTCVTEHSCPFFCLSPSQPRASCGQDPVSLVHHCVVCPGTDVRLAWGCHVLYICRSE